MAGNKGFVVIAITTALGILGTFPAAAATDRDRGGNRDRDNVLPCSLVGVNPAYHPDIFGNPWPPPSDDARQHAGAGRALGVGCCDLCHHDAVFNVDRFGDDMPVPAFGPRMVCTSCGIIGAFARPNWQERPTAESLTGPQWR